MRNTRLIGSLFAALLILVPATSRAEEDKAVVEIFKIFDRFQAVIRGHKYESLYKEQTIDPNGEPAYGIYKYFQGVGRRANGIEPMPEKSRSFYDDYSTFVFRGLIVCGYLNGTPLDSMIQATDSPKGQDIFRFPSQAAAVEPFWGANTDLAHIEPRGNKASGTYLFDARGDLIDGVVSFDAKLPFSVDKKGWRLSFADWRKIIDQHWSYFASLYLLDINPSAAWQKAAGEEKQRLMALEVALHQAVRFMGKNCRSFRGAFLSTNDVDREVVLNGLRELMITPLRKWPKREALAWWRMI